MKRESDQQIIEVLNDISLRYTVEGQEVVYSY